MSILKEKLDEGVGINKNGSTRAISKNKVKVTQNLKYIMFRVIVQI